MLAERVENFLVREATEGCGGESGESKSGRGQGGKCVDITGRGPWQGAKQMPLL